MKRRVALKSMAMAMGGLIALPAWANAWNKDSVQILKPLLSIRQEELLAEIVDTIIPATDTPGAKALHVHNFIQKMVADCYEKEVQQSFIRELDAVDGLAKQTFGKLFTACDAAQQIEILKKMELSPESEQKDFFSLVKKHTIQGYTTSEYVMTQHYNYKMIPGHYYGCVPVKNTLTKK